MSWRRRLAPGLAAALVVALMWGCGQWHERGRLELLVENSHQAAFQGAVWSVEHLGDEVARLEVAVTPQRWRQGLTNVGFYALMATQHISTLPVPAQPLSQTRSFLAEVEATAAELAGRAAAGTPPGATERRRLEELHQRALYLDTALRDLAAMTRSGRIRWVHAALAAAPAADGTESTPITAALTALESGWPGAPAQPAPAAPTARAPLDATAAAASAARFLGGIAPPELVARDEAAALLYFHAKTVAGTSVHVAVDTACRVPYMLGSRPVGPVRLDRGRAQDMALAYAGTLGLGPLHALSYSALDGIAIITLVPTDGQKLYVSDVVRMRIALDSGELLGFWARDFYARQRPRAQWRPALSQAQAERRLMPGLRVLQRFPALLETRTGEQLVWYFRTQSGEGVFDVFLNAATGQEERIDRVPAG